MRALIARNRRAARRVGTAMLALLAWPALAADPAEVRRLADDPDTSAEALAAAVRLATDEPADPQAFAALIEAVMAARGPTLAGGAVRSATLGDGSVQVVFEDGTRRVFDARTGGPAEAFTARGAAGVTSGTVTAGDGVCTASLGGAKVGVLAGCADLAGGVVSPDGKRAVTLHAAGRTERTEVLWDVPAGKPLATLRTDVNPAGTWVARFSPDGSRWFSYDNGGLRPQALYDAAGATVAVLGPSQRDGVFSPDGRYVVLAESDLQAYDASDGTLAGRLAVDGTAWAGAAFLSDGHTVALPWRGRTTLWDLDGGAVTDALGTWDSAGSDGRLLLAGRAGGPVRVVDTGPAAAVVRGEPGAALAAIAVAPDGTVAAADADRVRMWDPEGALVLDGKSPNVRWLAFVGNRLVGSTGEGWDLDGHRVADHLFRYLEQVTPAPSSKVAYAYDRTGSAPSRFRDLFTGETLVRVARDAEIGAPVFSADGLRLAGIGSGIGVWDAATGKRLLSQGEGAYAAVALSADGRRVAGFAKESREVQAWTVDGSAPWMRVRTRSPASALALAPDGGVLAIGDSAGRVWLHRPSADPIATAGHDRAVASLAFSPDGRLLVSSSAADVRLWDAASGALLVDLPAAAAPLVRFTPDGTALALASGGTVEIWPATVAGWKAVACGWIAFHPAGEAVRDACR